MTLVIFHYERKPICYPEDTSGMALTYACVLEPYKYEHGVT